jgi:hypothetical protein
MSGRMMNLIEETVDGRVPAELGTKKPGRKESNATREQHFQHLEVEMCMETGVIQ